MRAVEDVCAGIEIIDSRYLDFRFTLPDVIADNASSAAFVTGPVLRSPEGLDLSLEACLLEGRRPDRRLGHRLGRPGPPSQALALAANSLGARGLSLEAGWLVLTGGITHAVLEPGHSVTASFTSLGSLALSGG